MPILPTTASGLLKVRTAAAHHALDHHPLLRRLLDGQLDLATYGEILGVFFGFYRDYETTVQRLCDQAALTWHDRTKLPLLVADLLALGLPIPKDTATAALSVYNEASAYGLLYVMEGATLGGQIIGKHLERSLHLSPERGAAFFYSYGPQQVVPRWRETQAALDAYVEQGGDLEAVLAGAVAGFTELQERFTLRLTPSPSPLASGDKLKEPARER